MGEGGQKVQACIYKMVSHVDIMANMVNSNDNTYCVSESC